MTHTRPFIPDAPFYPGPTYRPPLKPVRSHTSVKYKGSQSSNSSEITNADPKINLDFKENSPFQEGVISEAYQRPDKSFFQEPQELSSLINSSNLVQKFLPKQADIDKILEVIQRKVLKGMHLPVEIKQILTGYVNSPYFKDIYLYLSQKKFPSSKVAIIKIEL